MIAKTLFYLMPTLAAVPLMAGFAAIQIPGQNHLKLTWKAGKVFLWAFFLWQWFLCWKGYELQNWLSYIRLVDPLIITGFIAAVLRSEDEHISYGVERSRRFVLATLPWILANLLIQLGEILQIGFSQYLSMISLMVVSWRINSVYGRTTIRPMVRLRITLLVMTLTGLIPLPVFRLVFLIQVAAYWWIRNHEAVRLAEEERQAHLSEKEIISHVSLALTEVIQDVGHFSASLKQYLVSICDALEIKSGAIYLWEEESKVFRARQVYGLFYPLSSAGANVFMREKALHEIVLSQTISDQDNLIWECGHTRQGIHLRFASQDERILRLGTQAKIIQTLVLAPLVLESELLGVLVLQNKMLDRYFTDSDAYLIYTFAHYATLMINAARMMDERLERERVANELNLGQQIQSDLLPHQIPKFSGIELAGSMDPAKEIGGDYFDFFDQGNGRLGIAIGDVSGKGVPAGMLMTILQALLESEYPHHTNTKDLLVTVNHLLSRKIQSAMFITFLLFEWNSVHKELKYTSCGHEHILHYKAAEQHLNCFRSGGIGLGMVEDASLIFRERVLDVQPGDTVVLYTDGVIEARNPQDELYGLGRLKSFVEAHQGLPAEEIRQHLVQDVKEFRQGRAPTDDITCLVMRF